MINKTVANLIEKLFEEFAKTYGLTQYVVDAECGLINCYAAGVFTINDVVYALYLEISPEDFDDWRKNIEEQQDAANELLTKTK